MKTQLDLHQIRSIPFYADVFHDAIQEQHYQYYFYNRQHDMTRACDQDKRIYRPLNDANLLLGKFCKRTVDELLKEGDEKSQETLLELKDVLSRWEQLYRAGGPFNTFRCVEQIFEGLTAIEYPISKRLAHAEELQKAFIQIPFLTKAFFQINFIVPDHGIADFLAQIIQLFKQDPALAYYFKQMMIYWSVLTTAEEAGGEATYFRTVKINLLPEVVNSSKNPIINEMVGAISSVTGCDHKVYFEGSLYAKKEGDNISVSQGNTNYKKFLNLLGVIDKVYDRNYNYAYLN